MHFGIYLTKRPKICIEDRSYPSLGVPGTINSKPHIKLVFRGIVIE